MKPDDFILLHLRGRFAYSIATLSWLEKKVRIVDEIHLKWKWIQFPIKNSMISHLWHRSSPIQNSILYVVPRGLVFLSCIFPRRSFTFFSSEYIWRKKSTFTGRSSSVRPAARVDDGRCPEGLHGRLWAQTRVDRESRLHRSMLSRQEGPGRCGIEQMGEFEEIPKFANDSINHH